MADAPRFTEHLPPHGELSCFTLYDWYDGPKIYILESEAHRLFVYWAGAHPQGGQTYWYLPIDADIQAQIDAQTLCLRTVLLRPGEAVTYGKDSVILRREPLGEDKPFLLPEAGLMLFADEL